MRKPHWSTTYVPPARLKLEQWPEIDHARWAAALVPSDPFRRGGVAAKWALNTQRHVEHCYGRWLFWLHAAGDLDPLLLPGARVTDDRLNGYLKHLQATKAPFSVQNEIQAVGMALQALDVKARIDRIIEAIADGTASPTLKAKLSELEAERAHLEAAHGPAPEKRELPEIHPNLPQLYKRRVTDLQRVLTLNAADRDAAAEILRSLIMQIVVRPGKRRGETIVAVTGSIPAILEFAGNQPRRSAPERSVAMVVPRGGIEPPTP
jgi:hypothetical protein